MQMDRAAKLRKEWGDKPCDHLGVEKEYILGGDTGDVVCTQCGETFTRPEWQQIQEGRKRGGSDERQ